MTLSEKSAYLKGLMDGLKLVFKYIHIIRSIIFY